MSKRQSYPTLIKCTSCGNPQQIWRRAGRQKKYGHIKDIYCPYCKKDVKGVEIKNGYMNIKNDMMWASRKEV